MGAISLALNLAKVKLDLTAYRRTKQRKKKILVLERQLQKEQARMQKICEHGLVMIHNGDPEHFIVCCALCGKSNYAVGTAMTHHNNIVSIIQADNYRGVVIRAPSPGQFVTTITDISNMKFLTPDEFDALGFQVLLGKYRVAAIHNKEVSAY